MWGSKSKMYHYAVLLRPSQVTQSENRALFFIILGTRGKKKVCFIKMQYGSHISSHAWIMYDLQCYLLDCLITSIFQNVYISFSSLRTNMYLYKNITYLWTLRIIFCQIPIHTSNWHRYPTFVHFSKINMLGNEIQKNYFSLWRLCLL